LTYYIKVQDKSEVINKNSRRWRQGRRHGGTGRNSTPIPHKGHLCKSSKTDEKIFGVWGGDVPNQATYLNFSLSLSQMVFKDRM